MSNPSADPMIGRLLDGRYQMRSRIARGGMATVYLATDLRLERRVAVKVMHSHLADDTEYKVRFIQEARSAARLAHPNVVNVYDQGQDNETAYLVMEYLPGITLRDLLNDHKVLTTEQALDVMEAVLSGLAAAHRESIVHRDLKPENVLLADDGRIKISDFGLARAASANTATGNALLGTIAYLSPELVTRGIADARSDIYAAGIMLYEMLAGEQPFKGDQPFHIAHQHANDSVPTPSTLNPQIPVELDELVLWATARDPDQRPNDAGAMLEQLHETQRLVASGATARDTGVHQTMVLPVAVNGSTGATQVLNPVRLPSAASDLGHHADELAVKSRKRRARGGWLFALVLLLTALAAGTGWYFGAGPGSEVTVPDVVGLDPAAAEAEITGLDLLLAPEMLVEFDPVVAPDLVVGTNPPPGTAVGHGSTVTLIISKGPEPLPIPVFVGLAEQEALELVLDSRFTSVPSEYRFNEAGAGQVIQALGSDGVDLATLTEYGDQRPVQLVVSLGPIPDVSGQSVADAKATLAEVGLTGVEGVEEFNSRIPAGGVIRTQLPADVAFVGEGGSVELIISKGIEQVAVPKAVGETWKEAKRMLEAAGFSLDYNRLADTFPGSIVTKTTPGAGEFADKGSVVKVNFQLQL